MKRWVGIAVAFSLAAWFGIYAVAAPPPGVLAQIVDDDPNPLPKYKTAAEELIPLRSFTRADFENRSPPTGAVHCPAEFEPNEGLLIRWGSYNSVLTELAVGVTTNDPEAIVYTLVTGASQQASATSTLTSAGADLTQVEFITYTANTVWIRDYGPRFIFEDSERAIVDHEYNRPRPLDNAFPAFLGALWGEQVYEIPLEHGGGNFHLLTNRDAFMTTLILDENPGLSEQDVKDLFYEYQNLDLTIYPRFPSYIDSTGHIDMWMMPLSDEKIVISQWSSGPAYTITEDATADLTARGYTVLRTPAWTSGGTHYTYTNAVILNDLLFISWFGGSYTTQDSEALAVYEAAMPDHQVIQVYSGDIIHAAGAIHCIVMHVPAYTPGLSVTPGDDLNAFGPVGGPFTPDSIVYTLENTSAGPIDYSVTHSAAWVSLINTSGTLPPLGTTTVTVSLNSAANALAGGGYYDTIDFINTTNHDGDTSRRVSLHIGGPQWDPVAYDVEWSTGVNIPTDVPLLGSDPNGDPLTYVIESLPAQGALSDPGAGAITTVPYELVGGDNIVHYEPPPGLNLQVTFEFSVRDATAGSNIATVTLMVGGPSIVHYFPMDSDPGWSTQGDWAFGQPTGGGGEFGGPDPTTGHFGDNVYGYNLNGDYTNNMPAQYLTTPWLDFTATTGVELRFWRWLGVESAHFDHAKLQVSNDPFGGVWTTLWENGVESMWDTEWTEMVFDLSAVADDQSAVSVRWVMGLTDGTNTYCGWNIDDVEIWGLAPVPIPGDLDGDGDVDLGDYARFEACLGGPTVTDPPSGCNATDFINADLDQDTDVDLSDFAVFEAAFAQ